MNKAHESIQHLTKSRPRNILVFVRNIIPEWILLKGIADGHKSQ